VYNNLTMSHIVPDLVDNQFTTQTTLGELLAMQLCQADAPCLWVATAYFNLDGLEKLGRRAGQGTGAAPADWHGA
jgi:hypothetical protein